MGADIQYAWKDNMHCHGVVKVEWVHWYNHRRLLSSIGYLPPAEAEADFSQQQSGQTMAA
ncbi:hypothetical protein ACBQ16_08350 [Halopseudomonas bauzanensis]|uniref:hypothetical protein n=1 Tax=Halopseudomonas bauzanensis TaxID=653930 RepID=UPI003525CACE